MKRFKQLAPLCSLTSLALLCTVASAPADNIQTLSDLNSSAQIDLSSQSGMYNWTVDGNNYLEQQWFWYRVGSTGPQSSIDSLNLTSFNNTGDELTTVWTDPLDRFSIDLTYLLTGGNSGSGVSDVQENITVNNLSSSNSLSFHFYQYSHFSLSGGNDSVQLSKNLNGNYYLADQTGGGAKLQETVITGTPLPAGAQEGETAASPQTLNNLNSGSPYTLNNNNSAGPGNVTWALEWDKTIGASSDFTIGKDNSLTVPEPSVLAIASLGLAIAAWRRRR
jgi:PEP-CTERM motif